MVQEINWSANAHITFREAIKYLEENFSNIELVKFTGRVDEKLFLLRTFPRLGRRVTKKSNLYKTVINKRIVLYYRYKSVRKEIVLVSFWNTLQNPNRLKL